MKKTGNILWGIVFVVLGLIFGLNAIGVTDIDVFFDGWWTLFIIIPSLIGIIKNVKSVGCYIWLAIGIVLLLSSQGILDMSRVGKLIFPAILVAIGFSIIFKDVAAEKVSEKIKELNKDNKEEYYATFSGQKLNYVGNEFKGVDVNAIFGGVDIDLRNAIIEQDQVINATAVFGGINILAPTNVNVQVKSNSLFGGVSNKTIPNKENVPTIYVKAFCLFGGAEIK